MKDRKDLFERYLALAELVQENETARTAMTELGGQVGSKVQEESTLRQELRKGDAGMVRSGL